MNSVLSVSDFTTEDTENTEKIKITRRRIQNARMKNVTEAVGTMQRFLRNPIATAFAHLLRLRPTQERIDPWNESRQAWIHAAVWRS